MVACHGPSSGPSPSPDFVDDATFGPGIAEIEVETQSKPKRKRNSIED